MSAFDARSARRPELPLVATPSRSVTSGELFSLSRALARRLSEAPAIASAAVRLVGLAAANGPAFLAALLAVRRARLGVLLLDAGAPLPELQRTAAALGASALVSCDTGWPGSAADFTLDTIAGRAEVTPPVDRPIVKVTSGSTGTPRGVVVTAENLCADEAALCASMGLRDDERILAAIPMAHSYGLSSVALPALLRGSLLLLPDESGPLAPLTVARSLGATFFPTVPAYLQGLVRLGRPELLPASVRLVISAGAPLSAATAAEFKALHRLAVHCFYGASECGGICYDREGGAAERGSVGAPVDGVDVTLDPEMGAVVVRSPAVGVGYLPTASPSLEGGRFRASDRAEWSDGELRLLGRVDALINVKGRKVDPAEVESVLMGLAGVLEVVVLGVPSRLDGSWTVRAVVACRPGTLAAEDVIAFCRTHLAEHKVPRSVRLVAEIPRTTRGKVDRAALADPTKEAGVG